MVKTLVLRADGTNCDEETAYAFHLAGSHADRVHINELIKGKRRLDDYQILAIPGGFAHGDDVASGKILANLIRFKLNKDFVKFIESGKLVIGICNGFQVLCEAHLLPGVLRQNDHLQYRCQWTYLKTENTSTVFTSKCHKGQVLKIPISHYEGRYYADDAVLKELEDNNRVAFRYATPDGEATREANPNGAARNIAGIVNKKGNVLGMMPHPERSCEDILGSADGNIIWESIIASI